MPEQQIRIAAYNVENLFSRPRAMNQSEDVAASVLRAHARVNELFEHETYTNEDKAEILSLLKDLRLLTSDGNLNDPNTMAVLRKYRGQLLRRPRAGGDAITVVAGGRADWTGWVDWSETESKHGPSEHCPRHSRGRSRHRRRGRSRRPHHTEAVQRHLAALPQRQGPAVTACNGDRWQRPTRYRRRRTVHKDLPGPEHPIPRRRRTHR